jgi:hypothetical protein
MTQLWIRVARYGDEPTPESWENRRQRVDRFLQRQPRETMPLRHNWGPSVNNQWVHGLIADHDGPVDDRHWEHLPEDVVSLRQPVHTHQGFVYPETVRHKLRQDAEDSPFPDDYGEYVPGGPEPKFVRHEGQHYLLDGHHAFAKARLMGDSSMWGKVFDTANPDHKASNCYECHVNETEHDYDHDSGDCPKCQQHGWSV